MMNNILNLFFTFLIPSAFSKCHESVGTKAFEYLSTRGHYRFNSTVPHQYLPERCRPVKLWYFGRHGTRYPAEEDIMDMQSILPKLQREILQLNQTSLCPGTLAYFASWQLSPDLNVSKNILLHEQGRRELKDISSRYVSRFPELFPKPFDNSTYYFKYTKSQRTEQSAKSFVSSIFDNEKSVWYPEPLLKDPLLKFYTSCPKWENETMDKNPEAHKQHDLFVVSSVMNRTISKVSRRFGLERNLTLEEITTVYKTCAFETAWMNGSMESEWCVGFDELDFQVMAYREDLKLYWKNGPGFRINYEQACVILKDAVGFFDEYKPNETYKKFQAYFGHVGGIVMILVRLGLFNRSELRSDNFNEIKDSYELRGSKIAVMGSNIAFVMYTCERDDGQTVKKIGLLTQEVPTAFEACGDKSICDYDEFRRNLIRLTGNCELSEICKV